MIKEQKVDKHCPLAHASKLIGDYWNILIIRQLMQGPKRFNEFIDEIEGSTSATISLKLKNLVAEGIVIREQFECIPPKVEYSLTKKGKKFDKLIGEIESLGSILK
jgi:DNA-binding HxlR family transcriptional regulator